MHYVYILYTAAYDKFYIGETCDVVGRLQQHNSKHYKHSSTGFTSDWRVALTWTLANRSPALILESYLKSMKSKKFIRQLCADADALNAFNNSVTEKFNIQLF